MATKHFLLISLIISAQQIVGTLGVSCTTSNYWEVAEAAASCDVLTLGDIVIPEKTTMEIDLKTGAKLIFSGHLTHVAAEWTGDLMKVKGTNVEIYGVDGHILDGLGPQHWKGANEPTIQRPKFFRLQVHNSLVHNLYIKNCPNNCMMIASSDTTIQNIYIDNKDGYPAVAGTKYAKNTDGFDIGSSTNLIVKDSVVYNQDDCVAVTGGSNLYFDNLWCNGSHGLSFSVKTGDVHDVEFKNSHVEYADNAIHVKGHNDAQTGSIQNVLYQNITFKAIARYAISVQQNYPSGTASANVKITGLTMDNVQGTMTGSKSVASQLICASGGCSDWTWNNVNIQGAHEKNQCQNVPSGIPC